MRVLIACGGTGGHLLPGLAVAEALLARRHEVRLLVSAKTVDHTAIGGAHLSVRTLPAIGLGRDPLKFLWCLAQAWRDCLAECAQFRPDVVLGMGGFTSAPAIGAAWWRRVPRVIHESNAVPGKANRAVSWLVDGVGVGLTECARFFPTQPVRVTGTPVRSALQPVAPAVARQELGLAPDRLTVLIMGGSQGSQAVNDEAVAAARCLSGWADRVQFVHLAGTKHEAAVRAAYAGAGVPAQVIGFCQRMDLAYSAADVVVARAGAATLAELAVFGLPAVLVPYPHAAGNHQWHNAQVLARAGAAVVVEESALRSTRLSEAVGAGQGQHGERLPALRELSRVLAELLTDDAVRERMRAAMRRQAVPRSAERLADWLEELGGRGQQQLELELAA